MPINQTLILLLVFICVVLVVLALFGAFTVNSTERRLRQISGDVGSNSSLSDRGWIKTLVDLTKPLGKLSAPEEGFEKSTLKLQFVYAGMRDPNAPSIFFSIKSVLTLGLPLLTFLFVSTSDRIIEHSQWLFILAAPAAIGYYGPNLLLQRYIKNRQRELFESFPDAVDLLTVCVEAGLGTESAMLRVAEDISVKSVVLAEELRLVNLELQAGADRERALRNLAYRTGVEEIGSFVITMIQAERFGTSVAVSLRVQSDMLRTRRQQKAEEAAAKISLKLLFPLMFCMFPALLVVLMGPAILNLTKLLGNFGQ